MDVLWEDPAAALMFRRFASFSRLIRFDRLGTGASDPAPLDRLPPWESYAEELAVVLDEVGSEQAVIHVGGDAGSMAMYFAATKPERTSALMLFNTTAKYLAADDYPIGISPEAAEVLLEQFDQLWGTEAFVQLLVPSRAGDERFRRWYAKFLRSAATPRSAKAFAQAVFQIDARPFLPLIHAPTLVLHRTSVSLISLEHGRYLADHIPGAKLIELPGSDMALPWERTDIALDQVEEFLARLHRAPVPTRVMATVLFTDIVSSTQRASRLGDRRWRELLEVHDELARRLVEEFAVHLAARVMAAAGSGEILTSRTVRDLVVGSKITVEDRGPMP